MGFLPPLTYKATNTSESVDIQVPLGSQLQTK